MSIPNMNEDNDAGHRDGVDRRRDQWHREMPGIDTTGMAIFGRSRLLNLAITEPIEAVFGRFEIDRGEADVLFTLLRSGAPYKLRPTELFRSLLITSGGMTFRLKRLEAKGLIARIKDDGDRRSQLVQLTETGKHVATSAFEEDMKLESKMLDCLDDTEKTMLAGLLKKLLRHVAVGKDQ